MGKNRCVVGDPCIDRVRAFFPAAELGAKVCTALELAYRGTAATSWPRFAPATTKASSGSDGSAAAWRIELKGAPAANGESPRRSAANIQLHVGNRSVRADRLPGARPPAESAGTSCLDRRHAPAALERLKAAVRQRRRTPKVLLCGQT